MQTVALILLGIAAVDGGVKLIEWFVSTSLWRMLLAVGILLLLLDLLVYDRTQVGRAVRRGLQYLWLAGTAATRWVWQVIARLRSTPNSSRP